jgi:mersacidin/lichenicidin family type 2 lantibiotic
MDVVRAWKDAAYRASLNEQQLASLPPNPAGAAPSGLPQLVGPQAITGPTVPLFTNLCCFTIGAQCG